MIVNLAYYDVNRITIVIIFTPRHLNFPTFRNVYRQWRGSGLTKRTSAVLCTFPSDLTSGLGLATV